MKEISDTDVNWEQVRIKAAISALQGLASNPKSSFTADDKLAKWSISCADTLIAELKKRGEK